MLSTLIIMLIITFIFFAGPGIIVSFDDTIEAWKDIFKDLFK